MKSIEEFLLHQKNPMELLKMNNTNPILKDMPEMRIISKREKGVYG
ncbi:MAG: hypothetical protein ACXQS8_07300 [Candidatus Helarchaeales archaeon]